MSVPLALIAAWARSAVVPRDGAFRSLQMHQIAEPVLQSVLQRAGLDVAAVDAVILGNALGAGGNPARMLALAAGLPERCAAFTVDTQCCSGLDAVAMGAALIAAGQAQVVVAGGAEAWSRAPIRMHRPLRVGDEPLAYDRPAFAPTSEQDPDLLLSAARYAYQQGYTRGAQEHYAIQSHARALAHQSKICDEIVLIEGVQHDTHPRSLTPERAARMPVVAVAENDAFAACGLSALTVSAQADGAALVLLMSEQACARWSVSAQMAWMAHASLGAAPEMPLVAAELASQTLLERMGIAAQSLTHVELHDAFAAQGLSFSQRLGLSANVLNQCGGGIARGHPIGASAAVALVRALTDMTHAQQTEARGLVAVAAAGGLGAAALIERVAVSYPTTLK